HINPYASHLILDRARIFSLAAGGSLTGTEERFRYAAQHGTLSKDSVDNIIGAYRFITPVRFRHHLKAILAGTTPDNHI
ncbi:putative nucleotidyltransferase substrate binding domain-containing protein, partial [Vibrio parahaemolyticus]|uniref:putative nucleotidyltransferase substrate binding domain-containing protein n=1 Tax=Vibrio parahaemolyticus TaxID=670 RepID=UPI00273B151B